MSRLQQIKKEVATKYHYGYWVDLVAQNDLFTIDKYFTEVLELYAKECSQASLEKASVLPFMDVKDFNGVIQYQTSKFKSFTHDVVINRESITNPENIVLL